MTQQCNGVTRVSPNALRLMLSILMALIALASHLYITSGILMITAAWYAKHVTGDAK